MSAAWSGLPTFLGTSVVGLLIVFAVILLAEILGKKWAPIIIIGAVCGLAILCDYSATRFGYMKLGGGEFVIAVGVMIWPILFLIQDYLNEFYGPKVAQYTIYGMFFAKIAVALATIWIINGIPNPPDPELLVRGEMFNDLMALSPRLNVASIVGAFLSSLVNVWIYDRLRKLTKGKHLWLRNNVSSMTSLVLDSFLFYFIGFLFVDPFRLLVIYSVSSLSIYWTTNILDTGFLYLMKYIKEHRIFGIDYNRKEALVIELHDPNRAA